MKRRILIVISFFIIIIYSFYNLKKVMIIPDNYVDYHVIEVREVINSNGDDQEITEIDENQLIKTISKYSMRRIFCNRSTYELKDYKYIITVSDDVSHKIFQLLLGEEKSIITYGVGQKKYKVIGCKNLLRDIDKITGLSK